MISHWLKTLFLYAVREIHVHCIPDFANGVNFEATSGVKSMVNAVVIGPGMSIEGFMDVIDRYQEGAL